MRAGHIVRMFRGGSALDFLKSISVKGFSAVVLLVSSSLLARSLAPAGFGIYTYIFSTTTVFLTPVSVAVGSVIVRELGKLHSSASGVHEINRQLSTALTVMAMLLVAPAAWITWSVRDLGADFHGWHGAIITASCIVLVFSMAINGIVAAVFQVNKEIALSNAINTLVRPVLFLVIVAVAVLSKTISVQVAIAGLAASSLLALLIGRRIAHRRYPGVRMDFRRGGGHWGFIAAAVPFLFLGLVQSAYGQMAIIALRKLGTVEQVGILGVALLISSPPSVLAGLAATYVTTDIARSPGKDGKALATMAAPVSFALGVGTLLYLGVFAAGGQWLIAKVYGVGYADAFGVALIVLAGQAISSLLGFAGPMLNMRGFERHSLVCSIAALVLLALCCWLLIPAHGVVGAALSTTIAVVAWKTALLVVARIKLGAWVLASPRIQH